MKLKFTLTNILLATAIVAVSLAFLSARKQISLLNNQVRSVKQELGHIDVQDRSQVHLRYLRSDAANTWRYRLFIPRENEYTVRFSQNTGAAALSFLSDSDASLTLDTGQYTMTITVIEQLLKPNDLSTQTFIVYVNNQTNSRMFKRSDLKLLANTFGNFDNIAHRLSAPPSHNAAISTYSPTETVPLLHIKGGSPEEAGVEPSEFRINLARRLDISAIEGDASSD